MGGTFTHRLGLNPSGSIPSSDSSVTLVGGGQSAVRRPIAIHVWRNVDQVTPIDVATTTATGINTGQADPPSITPTTSGAVVLAVGVGGNSAGGAVFTTSDLSNFLSITVTSGSFPGTIGMGSFAWTSGAFDPAQFGGGGTAAGYSWVAATMALRPSGTLTYVGGKAELGPDGSTADFAISLTDLTGGIDNAPAVGDIIIVAYGASTSGAISPALSVVTAGYTELANLFSDDNLDTGLSLNWKIAA